MCIKAEKKRQLGMHPATASNRLVKDLLWHFVQKDGYQCHHCGEPMTRDNFSIEHVEPWLHSDDPVKLFFDVNNISFSHQACNYSARRPAGDSPRGASACNPDGTGAIPVSPSN